ncbi:hypothetical protein CAAU_2641 [Caloramator australicus RC3]|uniref:Uncharacterized protein n=1 Tax=Caloramator australicus RC3 TaxID=857293 RepID=I7J6R9_9CLOT|nr:hypothetical protein CAAU_2641 [Caloramator australicus RC3]
MLHPNGLLLNLADNTWLTCPSALHPITSSSSLYISIPSQLFNIYLLTSFILSFSVLVSALLASSLNISLKPFLSPSFMAFHIFSLYSSLFAVPLIMYLFK